MNLRVRLLLIVVALMGLSLGCLTVPSFNGGPNIATPELREEQVPPEPEPLEEEPVQEEEFEAVPPSEIIVEGDNAVLNLQTQVEAVYAAAGNSVVHIGVTAITQDYFMNPVPQEGAGSGWVYDDQGHIVTNFHVVENADEIRVTFADGTTLPATVVGADPTYDLAVVEIDPGQAPASPLPLGNMEDLNVGQFVVAIGNPFGLDQTLTFGVISNLGRVIQSPDQRFIGSAIQTDAPINPGNSGGPLLNLNAEVIGVNAQIVSPSQASAGIGFAIPISLVRRVVPQLIETGEYAHSYMGVTMFPYGMQPQLVSFFEEAGYQMPDDGVMITEVVRGSPADEAGLQGAQEVVNTQLGRLPVGGDVIMEIDGERVESPSDLIAYLETFTQPGETVELTIYRDGDVMDVQVELGTQPTP